MLETAFRCNRLFLALVALLAIGTSACAAKRDSALKDADALTKATEQGDFTATMAQAEEAWANRINKADLLKSIDFMEKAVKMDAPGASDAEKKAKLAETYAWISRAYYLLADSHIRLEATDDEKDEEMMSVFEKGVTAAEKSIALSDPKFASTVAADESMWAEAMGQVSAAALPGLYWYATNLGKWALLEGIATILKRKDDIKVTMDWIQATDGNFFYGAPYRYFGVYHTKVPIGGGDPPKSKEAFDQALQIAPNYLAARVLMAESYAVLTGDAELFTKLLNEVVAADPNADPAIGPENALEQQKAKRLLDKAEDLFY